MERHHYHSPVGWIELTAENGAIVSLKIIVEPQSVVQSADKTILQCCKELGEYFNKKRTQFEVKTAPKGTAFQEKVWNQLLKIPYGKTISYAELANACGHPKACRAAGSANGKNPIAIIIPCHRVIASGGGMGGYAYGLEMKKFLLDTEK